MSKFDAKRTLRDRAWSLKERQATAGHSEYQHLRRKQQAATRSMPWFDAYMDPTEEQWVSLLAH